MKGKTLCIVIALMVLSVGAIIGANPGILGEFSSTLNGHPVQVTISRQDNGTITTMRTEELVENWIDHNQQFVRFIGTVKSVGEISLQLDIDPAEPFNKNNLPVPTVENLLVFPLDAPHLPAEYQEGHVYEFTGLLIIKLDSLSIDLDIYAFEIRHHGSLSAADQAAEYLERD